MNKVKNITMVFFMCMACFGCTAQTKKLKITVIVKSTTSQFFKSVQSGANAASKEYNIDLTFAGSENEEDYKAQIDIIERSIINEVDAIVLSAIDYNKLVDPVNKAIENGIPVVVIDSDVHSDKISARITTNNFEAGRMAGNTFVEKGKDHMKVGIVNFDEHSANGQEREDGFKSALQHFQNIESIYTVNVQSNVESATQGTKKLLAEHPDINTIITFNEWTTLGVGYAIREENLMDDIFVIGFDNNPVSVGMLETGEVDGLVVQNPFVMGYLGVEQAQDIIRGKNDKKRITYTKTVVVNKENMFETENQKIIFPFE